MTINAIKTNLQEILPLRNLFLQENNFQIRYNAQHERGWSEIYLITQESEKIGYGALSDLDDKYSVFEFYILPFRRKLAALAFSELIQASKASFITCQSNDS